jgi:hypothetical protein
VSDFVSGGDVWLVAVRTAPNAAAAAPVVKNLLRLAFVKSAGFFDAGFLFDSMGSPLPKRFSLAPSECFEGTSFSCCCLSQNVRLLGGSNQGWRKSGDSGFGHAPWKPRAKSTPTNEHTPQQRPFLTVTFRLFTPFQQASTLCSRTNLRITGRTRSSPSVLSFQIVSEKYLVLLLHGVSGRLSAYGNRNYVSSSGTRMIKPMALKNH